jgi:hypothetical protein
MSKNTIEAKAFHSETAAYAWVESVLWPNGPIARIAAALIASESSPARALASASSSATSAASRSP